MPKTKKLETLKQTHGKVNNFEVTTLDQIWGSSDNTPFGTTDIAEFEAKLKDMTRSDLENFARQHGSIIVESSERIRNELMKVFRNYVSLLQKPPTRPQTSNTKVSEAVQRILNEGKNI
jgi:hypothetical protein